MGQVFTLPYKIVYTASTYYRGFFHYWFGAGRHSPYDPTAFPPLQENEDDSDGKKLFKQHARVHLFSLASNFYLYHKPHYRKGSYRNDLVDNLRNVAIPGTGIPLSMFAWNRWVGLGYLFFVYPQICGIAAVHAWVKSQGKASLSKEFATRLLAPDDWFSYWRLNCNIVGLHALLNDMPEDYEMENKWKFLYEGMARGVPVSPYLKAPAIVVKHRNEEGGMGIFFYKNALDGGDWIIQERIENSDWVSKHLPPNAPLSTFRVITCSRAAITMNETPSQEQVVALSCVFRAGRAGASTDHDSILFDVDVESGKILGGTTNAHWYKLGLRQALLCPWRSSHSYLKHPDGDIPVEGSLVPDIANMLRLVEESHFKMCPRVPFAGWDVVLSSDSNLPVCLLEVNLSCNFFRGSFDKKVYLDFIDDTLAKLQTLRLSADSQRKQFQ